MITIRSRLTIWNRQTLGTVCRLGRINCKRVHKQKPSRKLSQEYTRWVMQKTQGKIKAPPSLLCYFTIAGWNSVTSSYLKVAPGSSLGESRDCSCSINLCLITFSGRFAMLRLVLLDLFCFFSYVPWLLVADLLMRIGPEISANFKSSISC